MPRKIDYTSQTIYRETLRGTRPLRLPKEEALTTQELTRQLQLLSNRVDEGERRLGRAFVDYVNIQVALVSSSPSSTNTGTEVLTFGSDPGWSSGTPVRVSATGGGLTLGTIYFYRRITSTTGTVHSTYLGAVTGGTPVNLTAAITATLVPMKELRLPHGFNGTVFWYPLDLYPGANSKPDFYACRAYNRTDVDQANELVLYVEYSGIIAIRIEQAQ